MGLAEPELSMLGKGVEVGISNVDDSVLVVKLSDELSLL